MRSPTQIDDEVAPASDGKNDAAVSSAPKGKSVVDAGELVVISDIPDDFPIGPAEIAAIETYFGDLLDMVLGGRKDGALTLSRHKGEG